VVAESQTLADEPRQLLALALEAARAAGVMLRQKLGTPLHVEFKGAHNNLVTDADKASEAIITGLIRARYPEHRILAEEGTTGADASPYRWVIDPVDGTTNFATRCLLCYLHWSGTGWRAAGGRGLQSCY